MNITVKNNLLALLFFFVFLGYSTAQSDPIKRIEPMSWWVDMADEDLQLLVYGTNISKATITLSSPTVTIKNIEHTDNPNYVFINLLIPKGTPAGLFDLVFSLEGKTFKRPYELQKRRENASLKPKIVGNEAIYLITPDRFSNANPSNDNHPSYLEKADRAKPSGRHGGDLQGIINHLDYIKKMGFTSLWLSPVTENNQPRYSYHGYAISDFYNVDKRFGTNEQFKQLGDELHQRGMNFFQDVVFNHCGSNYWWMKDLPAKDWINSKQAYGKTNFQNSLSADMHASTYDKKKFTKGYFDTNMPDMNYENSLLATYMIQNTLWWIEYANLDALRIDTYPFSDHTFLQNWRKRIEQEYPGMFILAEVWVNDVAFGSYWNSPHVNRNGYASHINSITDFPLYYAMLKTFKTGGNVTDVFNTLSMDFLYGTPEKNVIFLDNHDVNRTFYEVGEDIPQFKLATAFMFTTRGILQYYYGSELLMKGHGDHGILRQDMPGGWVGDTQNVFTQQHLTPQEIDMLQFNETLLNWRKQSDAIAQGKMIHFIPENNVYVYFRISDKEKIMVILNNSDKSQKLSLPKYNEVLEGHTTGKNIISNQYIPLTGEITIEAKTPYIIILK